jgi:hypothetical protein
MHIKSIDYLKSGTKVREDFHEFQQNLILDFLIHHVNLLFNLAELPDSLYLQRMKIII